MKFDTEKYKDKKILILGGGTSTLDAKWENLDYDYLWTCNDFYLEPRVLNTDIDLYLLAYNVDLKHPDLLSKLQDSNTQVVLETLHYRGKQYSQSFKEFSQSIGIPVYAMDLFNVTKDVSSAGYSGAMFRLIATALLLQAEQVMFAGFDGFNEQFTNIHAFTKHPGLKPTDTRRTFRGDKRAYYEVFIQAYEYFTKLPNYNRLQNLGEGFDYNIGTPVSREYFPLHPEIKKLIHETD